MHTISPRNLKESIMFYLHDGHKPEETVKYYIGLFKQYKYDHGQLNSLLADIPNEGQISAIARVAIKRTLMGE